MSKKFKKCVWLDMGAIPIGVGFCGSEKAYKQELKKRGVKYDGCFTTKDAAVNFVVNNNSTVALICFDVDSKDNHKRSQVDALLAHEAVHVMQECRSVMGGSDHGHEFEAYTVQHVLQFLLFEIYGD